MIRNFNHLNLELDFSNIDTKTKYRPSDIDMFYTYGDIIIFGEIKNHKGNYDEKQRVLHQHLADSFKRRAIYIYATHNKSVENGDVKVDVSTCKVELLYDNQKKVWFDYSKSNKTIQDIFNNVFAYACKKKQEMEMER